MSAPEANARRPTLGDLDGPLLLAVLSLVALGLVMVASASVGLAEQRTGNPFHYLERQALFLTLGGVLAGLVLRVPVRVWEHLGPWLLLAGLGLLVAVLIPGLGIEVNGARRWLPAGPFRLQASELVKLALVVYLAGFLVRRREALVGGRWGLTRVLVVLGLVAVLLLQQPDYGTAVVTLATGLGLLFLAGVSWWRFALVVAAAGGALAALALLSPYRFERLVTFLDPWADPYRRGFQLTQALIAFGRGEWTGVGLGAGIQKLHYLPEPHTDFLFAVLGEELGLLGALAVIALFALLVWRAFAIGRRAERADCPFAALLAYGLGLWLGLQAVVNLGVNMGALPTKGLTLPLMSYGGSSILASSLAVALLLRVGLEHQPFGHGVRTRCGRGPRSKAANGEPEDTSP
jgi:cell division protein FtsW